MANGDTQQDPSKPQDISAIINAITQAFSGAQQMKSTPQGQIVPEKSPQFNMSPPSASGAQTPPLNFAPPAASVPTPQTGSQSIGDFRTRSAARNAGMVSLGNSITGIVNSVTQRQQQKKAALAENYMMQIGNLLASGDPKDRQKAEMILEDPKILKTLDKGLNYRPLQEQVPPEAIGVNAAFQKIKQNMAGNKNALAGDVARKPQQRPVLPQPTQGAQIQAMMNNAIMQRMKKDPGFAFQLAKQTMLTSGEQASAEESQAGLTTSPAAQAQMDFQVTLAKDTAMQSVIVEAQKAQSEMDRQLLENKGKIDTEIAANAGKIAAARIEADATVEAAMARRSMSSDEFTTHSQPKLDAMHRAQQEMKTIMGGNKDPKIRAQLIMDLQQSGLGDVAKALPSGLKGFFGIGATPDWKAAQENLDAATKSFEDSLNRYKQLLGTGQTPTGSPTNPVKPGQTSAKPNDDPLGINP